LSRLEIGAFGNFYLFAALAAAPLPSWALFSDHLEVFVQENVTHDNNVFRLSENVGPETVGATQKGDTIFTTGVGFLFDLPVSLQRFQLGYTWVDSRYREFKDLDHRGHAARASWLWAVTPRITGDATYQEESTLASFANIQDRRPDLITARLAEVNAAWMMTPSWRLHGRANGGMAEHSDTTSFENLRSASAETGLSYVTAQENRIGVAVRGEKGRSPEDQLVEGVLTDNAYSQWGAGVQGRWVVTGHSRFDGRLDYTRRTYEEFTQRNYSGPTFTATYTWTPTGKITVATTAQRDVAPLQDINTSFVLVTSLAVRPDWAISDKLTLRGNLQYAKWDYRGDPALGQDYEHRVTGGGVALMYRPWERVAITGAYQHERRSSTLLNGDYRVDVFSIEGRIGF
jgi:exopolysaccharide biosynthesis operon protein EpsL